MQHLGWYEYTNALFLSALTICSIITTNLLDVYGSYILTAHVQIDNRCFIIRLEESANRLTTLTFTCFFLRFFAGAAVSSRGRGRRTRHDTNEPPASWRSLFLWLFLERSNKEILQDDNSRALQTSWGAMYENQEACTRCLCGDCLCFLFCFFHSVLIQAATGLVLGLSLGSSHKAKDLKALEQHCTSFAVLLLFFRSPRRWTFVSECVSSSTTGAIQRKRDKFAHAGPFSSLLAPGDETMAFYFQLNPSINVRLCISVADCWFSRCQKVVEALEYDQRISSSHLK